MVPGTGRQGGIAESVTTMQTSGRLAVTLLVLAVLGSTVVGFTTATGTDATQIDANESASTVTTEQPVTEVAATVDRAAETSVDVTTDAGDVATAVETSVVSTATPPKERAESTTSERTRQPTADPSTATESTVVESPTEVPTEGASEVTSVASSPNTSVETSIEVNAESATPESIDEPTTVPSPEETGSVTTDGPTETVTAPVDSPGDDEDATEDVPSNATTTGDDSVETVENETEVQQFDPDSVETIEHADDPVEDTLDAIDDTTEDASSANGTIEPSVEPIDESTASVATVEERVEGDEAVELTPNQTAESSLDSTNESVHDADDDTGVSLDAIAEDLLDPSNETTNETVVTNESDEEFTPLTQISDARPLDGLSNESAATVETANGTVDSTTNAVDSIEPTLGKSADEVNLSSFDGATVLTNESDDELTSVTTVDDSDLLDGVTDESTDVTDQTDELTDVLESDAVENVTATTGETVNVTANSTANTITSADPLFEDSDDVTVTTLDDSVTVTNDSDELLTLDEVGDSDSFDGVTVEPTTILGPSDESIEVLESDAVENVTGTVTDATGTDLDGSVDTSLVQLEETASEIVLESSTVTSDAGSRTTDLVAVGTETSSETLETGDSLVAQADSEIDDGTVSGDQLTDGSFEQSTLVETADGTRSIADPTIDTTMDVEVDAAEANLSVDGPYSNSIASVDSDRAIDSSVDPTVVDGRTPLASSHPESVAVLIDRDPATVVTRADAIGVDGIVGTGSAVDDDSTGWADSTSIRPDSNDDRPVARSMDIDGQAGSVFASSRSGPSVDGESSPLGEPETKAAFGLVAVVAGAAAVRFGANASSLQAALNPTMVRLQLRAGVHAIQYWWDRLSLPRIGPVPGYSRYDDSDPLENEVRRDVYESIERSPGVYLTRLSEESSVPRSTVRYHVRVLETEGLISAVKVRGRRRFVPADSDEVELATALSDDATAAVLGAVATLEPASGSSIAERLDRDPSTVSHHLARLSEAGLVVREREGCAVLNRLSPDARETLVASDSRSAPHEAKA